MRRLLYILLFVVFTLTAFASGWVVRPEAPKPKIQESGYVVCRMSWLLRVDGRVEFLDLILCKENLRKQFWVMEKPEEKDF